ncbi:hypothetical protein K788_0002672 [Paraburkholderia caribensis MBA4]|uniref:Uncharacterized protein n=1 Tax=Paraburkholderia caribensis MBA4 TaxID=1323664 RepID=A0A0P0R725_9BURK|nr:hypothetical protein K788_0002672 [Paraburkholderia caribensis MBA4]
MCGRLGANSGAPAQALTWFGILLDAAQARNRIGQPDKTPEQGESRAAPKAAVRRPALK